MRRAIPAIVATMFVTGCAIGGGDPYEATCADTGDLSGLDSVSKSLVDEIKLPGDRDRRAAEVSQLISQECEGKPTSHKPSRAAAKAARQKLAR